MQSEPPPLPCRTSCPRCGSTSVRATLDRRFGLYPMSIVAIIGLAFAMFHQLSQPQIFRCDRCGVDFARRTTLARFAHGFVWVLGLLFVLKIVGFIVVFMHSMSD